MSLPPARATSQIRVRRLRDGFAYTSIVCAGWSIHGIRVRGELVQWPEANGYPIVAPPPELRAQLEQEIVETCRRFER